MAKASEGSQHSSGSKDEDYAGIAQLVEHDLAKVGVASSSLVSRSKFLPQKKYPQRRIALGTFCFVVDILL